MKYLPIFHSLVMSRSSRHARSHSVFQILISLSKSQDVYCKYIKYRINHLLHSSWNMGMSFHSQAVFILAFGS